MRRSLILLLVVVVSVCFHGKFASAQEAGIKLIPATVEQRANPGEIITEELKITNISDEDKEFYLYKRDIKGVGDGGVPIFSEENEEKTGYEVSGWINLQEEPIAVKAGEEYSFLLTIRVPEDATPGSHFGGVFVSAEPPKLRQTGAGVGYEVASIISIRISGDVVDNARIRSFSTDKLFYGSKHVAFTAKIENQGNILVRPRGPLTITSMFGGDAYVQTINENQAGVFPGTVRDLAFNWDEEGIGFGRYEAVLALGYDGEDGQKTIDATLVFWVFPAKIIFPILGAFLVIIVGGYFLTRYYINQAILRSGGGRRIPTGRYRKQVGISRFAFVFVALMGVLVLFLLVLLVFFA